MKDTALLSEPTSERRQGCMSQFRIRTFLLYLVLKNALEVLSYDRGSATVTASPFCVSSELGQEMFSSNDT